MDHNQIRTMYLLSILYHPNLQISLHPGSHYTAITWDLNNLGMVLGTKKQT